MALRRRCTAGAARVKPFVSAPDTAYPWIRRQQGDAFHLSLRNQDSIEGIFMNGRQIIDCNNMLTPDGKLVVAVIQQPASEQSGIMLKSCRQDRS